MTATAAPVGAQVPIWSALTKWWGHRTLPSPLPDASLSTLGRALLRYLSNL
jgi:hypothetical protein